MLKAGPRPASLKPFSTADFVIGRKCLRDKKWEIIWTLPYFPKFQPIELVWGVGKQRAAGLYKPGRTMLETREHLRRGWYGGADSVGDRMEKCNVKGCWEKAMGEIDKWISHGGA